MTINQLANQVAYECLCEYCQDVVQQDMKLRIVKLVKEEIEAIEDEKTKRQREIFVPRLKALASYQRKFKSMIEGIWKEEEAIILANLKKMKKAWMTKDTVDEILYPISIFEKKLADGTTGLYVEIMTAEGSRIVSLYDFDMIFDVENPAIQAWLAKYTPKFSKKLEAVNVEKLRAELSEGIKAGESIRELSKRVNLTYANWSRYRSENIARSETIRASNAAAKAVYKQSGVVKKIIWITTQDDRTCDFCFEMDGKVIDIEESFFNLGDTFTIEGEEGKKQSMNIDYEPCDYPPLHASCLLPGTRLKPAGDIIAGLRARYKGPVIKLIFSDNSRLSVTGNHLLLTPHGFASAHLLCKGDDILYCPNAERIIFSNPNNDGNPALIEDIIKSLSEAPGMAIRSVPLAPEYLHNDGRFCDSNIDIIRPDGFLRDTREPIFLQKLQTDVFMETDADPINFSGFSNFTSIFKTLASAADSIMGGLRKVSPFFLRRLGHANIHGFASTTRRDIVFNKTSADNTSGNIELFRKFLFRHSGLIKTKKVIDIKIVSYHGFVYDLQTSTSLYISNVIMSNCRCAVGAMIED